MLSPVPLGIGAGPGGGDCYHELRRILLFYEYCIDGRTSEKPNKAKFTALEPPQVPDLSSIVSQVPTHSLGSVGVRCTDGNK